MKNVLDLSFHMFSPNSAPTHTQTQQIRSVNWIKLIQKVAPIGENPGEFFKKKKQKKKKKHKNKNRLSFGITLL
jgi:hypothetical protein